MIISKQLRDSEYWDELRGLVKMLGGDRGSQPSSAEALQDLVRELKEIIECDHIFLSLYDSENKMFRAAAWHSPLKPGDIVREQKFMWDKYCQKEPVLINDLTQYNYRLRPAAARIQMLSMAGVPMLREGEIAGVLELYSNKQDAFSDLDFSILNVYAKRAAAIVEHFEQAQELRYVTAENSLLKLLISSEKVPVTELLANLGKLFKSALLVEGIAVLAVDSDKEAQVLTEIMTDGIPQASVTKLVAALTGEFLQRLANLPDGAQERYLVKQSPQSAGGEARAAYIIPIVWRQQLHGLIVFYRKDLEGARPARLLRFIQQITEHIGTVFDRKSTYIHMQKMSLTDALTGLSNRRLFDYALSREYKRVKREGKALSLLMLDIDYFKKINDSYGHGAGDLVLGELGTLLAASLRGTDVAARYGGEEFAVILPDTGRNEAMMIAERLREEVAGRKFISTGIELTITISIGIATYEEKGDAGIASAQALIWAADQALYRAKQLGRNLTIVWSRS